MPQNNSACFTNGTLIRIVQGDVPVESLQVGDQVVTSSGKTKSIRWLGCHDLSCLDGKEAMFVRIAAHTFAEERPSRDLYLLPSHAICIDAIGEILIPVAALINGSTICYAERQKITCWHVELDDHDILLAENLTCESSVDRGHRDLFTEVKSNDHSTGGHTKLISDSDTSSYCRPFYDGGPILEGIRQIVRRRARTLTPGWHLDKAPFAGLHLLVDGQVALPSITDLSARFLVQSQARDVRLKSSTVAPIDVIDGSSDRRLLGVSLSEITIDDGLTGVRKIALDDSRLSTGFHSAEYVEDMIYWRWTDGEAVLPCSLWDGCLDMFFLRVTLAAPALPRWVGPGEIKT